MVDYAFYTAVYLGSTVPEKAFPGAVKQAAAELASLRRCCRVVSPGEDSEKMALCAMAETLYAHRNRGLASASVGSVRVQYDTGAAKLRQQLQEQAGIYLDLYRGVEV